ncbi:MAG: octaprenyl diphosphate synthase [Gammaproteobacteria bacterium]|nr:octaprenyl diphosphate synthase [Gammaproteobacteria bacterium]
MSPTPSPPSHPALYEANDLLAAQLAAVEVLMRECLHCDVPLINQVSHYVIASGGKRLRPVLVLLSACAMGYAGRRHIDLAVIVELIHTATLLHDDVVDSSRLRRGQKTANIVWGNEASVLVGDFLYSRAFQMMVDIGEMKVLKILADATNTIAEGEVMQLVNCRDPATTEARYLDTIRFKTAKLFEAATRLGAVIAVSEVADEKALACYGRHLGTAFQLVDDALDYSATATDIGKNIGDDLAEGKPTLPLLYAMWQGSSAQAAFIRRAIEDGGLEQIEQISAAIESTGAITYTLALAEAEAWEAREALAGLPGSPFLDALVALTKFTVERKS